MAQVPGIEKERINQLPMSTLHSTDLSFRKKRKKKKEAKLIWPTQSKTKYKNRKKKLKLIQTCAKQIYTTKSTLLKNVKKRNLQKVSFNKSSGI